MGTGRTSSRMLTQPALTLILHLSFFLVLALLPGSYNVAQGWTLEKNIESSDELFKLTGSQLNEEAKQNFEKWLSYVHATSDSETGTSYDSEDFKIGDEKTNKFNPKTTIVVAQDGSGQFTTIQAAVDSLPKVNHDRVLIKIKAGVYRERVKIPSKKHYITMEGEEPKYGSIHLRTIVTYNSTAGDLGGDGLPLKTFGSATFAINAKYFIAKYISFVNTAPTPKPGAIGGQAVALRISGDRAAFYSCSFLGEQDTLYDHKGRHFFHQCFVQGTVDFVFGNGRSLYMRSHLHALPNNGIPGALTAQKRNTTSLNTGFSFVNSLITGHGSAYLGRAWGNDSRVVFAETFMSQVVIPGGWNNWGIPDREKTVFYAEYNCTGPGANSTGRVNWAQQLTYEQAKPFLSIRFINGKKWLQNPKSLEKEDKAPVPAGQDPSDLAPSSLPEWEPNPEAPSLSPLSPSPEPGSPFPFPWWNQAPTPAPESGSESPFPLPWWNQAPTPAPESGSGTPFPFPWWNLAPTPAPESGSGTPFPFPWWNQAPTPAPESGSGPPFPFPWWNQAPTPAPESGSGTPFPFPWWNQGPTPAPESGSGTPFPFPWWIPGSNLVPPPTSGSESPPATISFPFLWWNSVPTHVP